MFGGSLRQPGLVQVAHHDYSPSLQEESKTHGEWKIEASRKHHMIYSNYFLLFTSFGVALQFQFCNAKNLTVLIFGEKNVVMEN